MDPEVLHLEAQQDGPDYRENLRHFLLSLQRRPYVNGCSGKLGQGVSYILLHILKKINSIYYKLVKLAIFSISNMLKFDIQLD